MDTTRRKRVTLSAFESIDAPGMLTISAVNDSHDYCGARLTPGQAVELGRAIDAYLLLHPVVLKEEGSNGL